MILTQILCLILTEKLLLGKGQTMLKKIKNANVAAKDFFWFSKEMHKMDIRTKHAFMAYSSIVFLSGALVSDLYDYSLEHNWMMAIYSCLRGIQ